MSTDHQPAIVLFGNNKGLRVILQISHRRQSLQPFVLWQRCICKICIWSWRSICPANTFLPFCLLHYERCSCKTSTSCLSIARRQDCRRRRNGFTIMWKINATPKRQDPRTPDLQNLGSFWRPRAVCFVCFAQKVGIYDALRSKQGKEAFLQHWPGYSTSEIKRSAYAGCPETQKLSSQFSVCLTYLPMTREFVETLTGGRLFMMRMRPMWVTSVSGLFNAAVNDEQVC